MSIKKIRPELKRLIDDDPKLTSLCVVGGRSPRKYHKGVTHFFAKKKGDWANLGNAIRMNTKLRQLRLHNLEWGSPPANFLVNFYSLLNTNRSISRLDMHNFDICDGDIFVEYLVDFLIENPNLKSLNFSMINMESNGIPRLCNVLGRMQHSLKYLDLSLSNISDGDSVDLVSALNSNHLGLRSLELCNNNIGIEGCCALRDLLAHPDCMLTKLNLQGNNIDDDGAIALSDGLSSNDHLKTLDIRDNYRIKVYAYGAFMTALCSGTRSEGSFDDFLSINNDTIQRILMDWGSPPADLSEDMKKYTQLFLDTLKTRIQTSLHLNRLTNKRTVAKRKFILRHLVYEDRFDLLDGIRFELVPCVLAVIVDHATHNENRTDANAAAHRNVVRIDYSLRLMALYDIIRHCPHICERHFRGRGIGKSTSVSSQGEDHLSPSSKRMRLNEE